MSRIEQRVEGDRLQVLVRKSHNYCRFMLSVKLHNGLQVNIFNKSGMFSKRLIEFRYLHNTLLSENMLCFAMRHFVSDVHYYRNS